MRASTIKLFRNAQLIFRMRIYHINVFTCCFGLAGYDFKKVFIIKNMAGRRIFKNFADKTCIHQWLTA